LFCYVQIYLMEINKYVIMKNLIKLLYFVLVFMFPWGWRCNIEIYWDIDELELISRTCVVIYYIVITKLDYGSKQCTTEDWASLNKKRI
jgi:hypothetical protein